MAPLRNRTLYRATIGPDGVRVHETPVRVVGETVYVDHDDGGTTRRQVHELPTYESVESAEAAMRGLVAALEQHARWDAASVRALAENLARAKQGARRSERRVRQAREALAAREATP